jgi:hypothetical protein
VRERAWQVGLALTDVLWRAWVAVRGNDATIHRWVRNSTGDW